LQCYCHYWVLIKHLQWEDRQHWSYYIKYRIFEIIFHYINNPFSCRHYWLQIIEIIRTYFVRTIKTKHEGRQSMNINYRSMYDMYILCLYGYRYIYTFRLSSYWIWTAIVCYIIWCSNSWYVGRFIIIVLSIYCSNF